MRRELEEGFSWNGPPNLVWSPGWYVFTVRGAESTHIYLWVMKDLSWACGWYWPGHVFGIAAVLWSAGLLARAVSWRNTKEVATGTAQLIWLLSNVWWMSGELHDLEYPSEPPVYDERMNVAGAGLKAALVLLAFQYAVVQPCDPPLLRTAPSSQAEYNDTGLRSKYAAWGLGLDTWRDLELVHLFFWLGKDTAWNAACSAGAGAGAGAGLQAMWIIFALPTVLLALDFVHVTLWVQGLVVENAHNQAQFMWVAANLVWAAGEIWQTDNDEASGLLSPTDGARSDGGGTVKTGGYTLRWGSALLLFLAFLPVIAVHVHWLLCSFSELVYTHPDLLPAGEHNKAPHVSVSVYDSVSDSVSVSVSASDSREAQGTETTTQSPKKEEEEEEEEEDLTMSPLHANKYTA